MDFSALNNEDRVYIEKVMEKKQMQDFLQLYSKLSIRCFSDCVNDFSTRTITDKESACTTLCVEKFIKMSQRMSQRFAEQHMINQQ
ncbi:hypothetical protein SARC_07335 [Sphaeroforma arctica JP610]|uniref:Mitochondrial import inner membrane translocase subunit n=1 Tax=Sphaeroforma arctica JP610 TaxID=667725 RepID=A0A0L0FTX9_9EUKA|nr:hypothetical protein SARC_07335 [Sphaeroforma arctica JP610]KNC80300.1 hypothetical protein SARC_07335 [Sphaeroforma arctica JP610]|eukprot:XP_014154202.1 hypothetical protein SARC_07335 [Sphaeroforma arctica JP610]